MNYVYFDLLCKVLQSTTSCIMFCFSNHHSNRALKSTLKLVFQILQFSSDVCLRTKYIKCYLAFKENKFHDKHVQVVRFTSPNVIFA